MSWFGWFKGCKPSEDVDYKAKLEHKILHAKQTPETVFDITECNLKEVPAGIYSWCKVCLKEALLLQNNRLTSLDGGGNLKDLSHLKILDLHQNQLSRLPDGIGKLENLRILYLHNNNLKTLPKTFDELQNLITLNLSDNKFSIFPEILCQLRRLRNLDISCNNITKLSTKVSHVQTLDTLTLDSAAMKYPPAETCEAGLEAIMKFLCEASNIDYISPSKAIAIEEDAKKSASAQDKPKNVLVQSLDDYWKNLEKKKEDKRKERLEMERLLQEQQENQASAMAELRSKRTALVNEVAKCQSKLEDELLEAQKIKDDNRRKLLLELVEVEQHADKMIEELLTMAEHSQSLESLLETEKRERKEFEDIFLKQRAVAEELRQNDILEAMRQSLQQNQVLQIQDIHKQELTKRLQEENNEIDASIADVLEKKSNEKNEAVENLLSEEQYQKEALISLMKAKDSDSLRIRDQIYLIQCELTKLTLLELKQKDLKIDFEVKLLEQKREIFTGLLLQLMDKQKLRQEEMMKRLLEMEQQRQTNEQDYWLIQYQRLLDHKPESIVALESNMDPLVRELLIEANEPNYIPLFARKKISFQWLLTADAEQLREAGVHNTASVLAILAARRARNKLQNFPQSESEEEGTSPVSTPPLKIPSVPSETSIEPLNARRELECVVCMEKQCSTIYLPCGHVCCCEDCGAQITSCPLCRGEIEQRIILHFSN